MNPLAVALVIARRDYVASVWSRSFLFFLVGPLLPLVAGGMFAAVGAGTDRAAPRPVVAVIAAPDAAAAIGHARAALGARLGEEALPAFRYVAPAGSAAAQARALLAGPRGATGALAGGLDAPALTAPRGALGRLRGDVALVLDRARADRAIVAARGAAPRRWSSPSARSGGPRATTRRGGG